MRILYLGNNWLGWQVLKWLKEQGEEIAGLVIHPLEKRKYGEEILRCAGLGPARVFDGSRLQEPEIKDAIRSLRGDMGFSVLFNYLLKAEFLEIFPRGVINLHPSLLPYNRGQNPNVWSIIEETPAGATIHYVDEHLDTGDIIAQREVPVEPVDTGESLYRKLEGEALALVKQAWPSICAGGIPGRRQDLGKGTFHRTRDLESIDAIDLRKSYRARDLLNIIRARTFPPHRGAYFEVGGRRVYVRVALEYEKE